MLRKSIRISTKLGVVAYLHGIAFSKRRHVIGKVAYFWYMSAINKYWNDGDVSFERGDYLGPYVIVRLVQPTIALLVLGVKPVRTDSANENVADRKLVAEVLYEINPSRDVVYIDE